MYFPTARALMLLLSCIIIACSVRGQPDTVLKGGNERVNPITVKAITSHQYITNNNQSKIAVLFDISTSDINTSGSSEHNSEGVRDPYELAIVLDRSGSMSGAKIEQSKAAMMSIVDNMIDGDIIHIIQYDHAAEVLIRNGGVSSQTEILHTIQQIQPRGSTNLFGGLSKAHRVLQESMAERQKTDNHKISHSRIFLFSDGLLNHGVTNQNTILEHVLQWKNELDITISTFGIGYDFDRNIMTSIAETANGDFFFINSANAISKVIEIARKDAANIVATEAVLRLQAIDDAKVDVGLNNLFERGGLNGLDRARRNEIEINDLRTGGAKYVLVELMVNPKDNDDVESESIDILEWKLSFNPKSETMFQNMSHSIRGMVSIKVTNADSERLSAEGNQNEEVIVLWRMNEMIALDKEIVDDIAGGNVEDAQMKRSQRNTRNKALNEGSMYQSFISRFADSKLGAMVQSMQRRMVKGNIEAQMHRLGDMDQNEVENLLFDYKSDFELNQNADYDHEEL